MWHWQRPLGGQREGMGAGCVLLHSSHLGLRGTSSNVSGSHQEGRRCLHLLHSSGREPSSVAQRGLEACPAHDLSCPV